MMEIFYKPNLEQLFLFLLTAVRLSKEATCPYDVADRTNSCLSPYKTQINTMEMMKQTFYSGVDVETIRAICHSLMSSFACAQNIRSSCPDTEFSDMEVVLEDVLSVAELCQRIPSPHHFLEVYARHQNCFTRLGANSETCYQTFRIDGEPLQEQLQRGHMVWDKLSRYCREFSVLVECIKAPVAITCGEEASELVEFLVRPSVKFSEHCKNDSLATTTATPSKKSHTHQVPTSPGAYGSGALSLVSQKYSIFYCTIIALVLPVVYKSLVGSH